MAPESTPFNILWITERFPPLSGGMAMSAYRQVNALRQRGHTVDVILFHNSQTEHSVSIQRKERDRGADIMIRHRDILGNAAQRAWREVFDRFSDTPYDLTFGFGSGFPGHTAVTYAAWLGIPSMISVRGNDFDRDWFDSKRSLFVQGALKRADAVATVSLEKADKIRALFPGKRVFWAPNGVDPSQWALLPDEKEQSRMIRNELNGNGKRIIGLFGELKYKKQVPLLLSAIRERGLMERVSLLVTGRMDAETDTLLSDPSLSPVSRHLSFRTPEELPPLYAACDFMAIPSLFEGFPNVLLESMAAGSVPVVSDAGAMKDVIRHGETGFLFKGTSRADAGSAIAEALKLSDKELIQMKERVKDYVADRFSIDNEVARLETEIRAIVT